MSKCPSWEPPDVIQLNWTVNMRVSEIRKLSVQRSAKQGFSYEAGVIALMVLRGRLEREMKKASTATRVFYLDAHNVPDGGSASAMQEFDKADLIAALDLIDPVFKGKHYAMSELTLETVKLGRTKRVKATATFETV